MDLLVQRPAVHGDSECHQGRRVLLGRWEKLRSAQSASANQCRDQNTWHAEDAVEGAGHKMPEPQVEILQQVLVTSGQYAGRLDNQQICSTLARLSHELGIWRIVADHLAVADTQAVLARP